MVAVTSRLRISGVLGDDGNGQSSAGPRGYHAFAETQPPRLPKIGRSAYSASTTYRRVDLSPFPNRAFRLASQARPVGTRAQSCGVISAFSLRLLEIRREGPGRTRTERLLAASSTRSLAPPNRRLRSSQKDGQAAPPPRPRILRDGETCLSKAPAVVCRPASADGSCQAPWSASGAGDHHHAHLSPPE